MSEAAEVARNRLELRLYVALDDLDDEVDAELSEVMNSGNARATRRLMAKFKAMTADFKRWRKHGEATHQ